jgi:hypothetical protein
MTDRTRMFHIFGLAVCTNEQTVDFIFLFNALKTGPETKIRMCWANMKDN